LHVVHHGLELLLVNARTHVNARVEAISDFQLFGARDEARNEVVINGFVDGDAAGRGAALAGGAKAAPNPFITTSFRASSRAPKS